MSLLLHWPDLLKGPLKTHIILPLNFRHYSDKLNQKSVLHSQRQFLSNRLLLKEVNHKKRALFTLDNISHLR